MSERAGTFGPHRSLVGRRDAARGVLMLLGGIPATLLPAALDRWVVRATARLYALLRPGGTDRFARRMAEALGVDESETHESATIARAVAIESTWSRVRNQWRPAWKPEVSIEGLRRLQEARALGKGTILWRMGFCDTQIAKIALAEAGVPLVHLSQAQHGARSEGLLARRLLAPLHQRSENHFIAERVIIPWGGSPTGATRRLLLALSEENAVVSIFGDARGIKPVQCPFLGRVAAFPIGAPSLALRTSSPLLPCYTVAEEVGRYRVVIDSPIELDRAVPKREAIEAAVREFTRRLERTVRDRPGSWSQWGMFLGGHPPYGSG